MSDRTRYESHTWGGDDGDECIVCGVTWQDCEGDCAGPAAEMIAWFEALPPVLQNYIRPEWAL